MRPQEACTADEASSHRKIRSGCNAALLPLWPYPMHARSARAGRGQEFLSAAVDKATRENGSKLRLKSQDHALKINVFELKRARTKGGAGEAGGTHVELGMLPVRDMGVHVPLRQLVLLDCFEKGETTFIFQPKPSPRPIELRRQRKNRCVACRHAAVRFGANIPSHIAMWKAMRIEPKEVAPF